MKPRLTQAIALEYGQRAVPIVTAKGEGELAQRILSQAQESGVHVAQDPELLSLLSQLEVDQEVPNELYTAVAVILAWVYWLKGMQPGDEKKSPTEHLRDSA
jgi:flagellar biosynthesis protein